MTTGLTHRVAAEIRAELARQKMSQREFARKLGIDPALVSKRLAVAPGRSWTIDELDSIAVVLDVPVDQLLASPAFRATAA